MSGLNETKQHAATRWLLLVLCLLLTCAVATAQRRPAPRPSPTPARATDAPPATQSVDPETADLAITAHVTARELKFDEVPNAHVEFTGQPRRDTVWDAQRQNLPRPVQPGVTYRNIGINLVITSVFADIDRIVAEALGEVPTPDDAPNAAPPPDNPTATDTGAPIQKPAPPRTLALAHNNTPPARSARTRRAGRPR
jgi:hypothetical protein